jgi:hypothetical protein
MIARNRRRSRLRRVADPTDRPTENATRSGDAAGSLTKLHHKAGVLARRPRRASSWNGLRPLILQIKP